MQLGVLARRGDGLLFLEDGGGGLEGEAAEDGFAVADAALDAAAAVGGGADAAGVHVEGVVVLAAAEARAGKAAADLEAFGGGEAHQGFGEVGLEFVEDGLAEPGGDAADGALDDAADAVALGADGFDEGDHLFGHRGVGAADDIGLDVGEGDGGGIDLGGQLMDGFDVGDDLQRGAQLGEDLFRDGSGGDAADGLARGGATAALPVADAVFGLVGEVGVRGAEGGLHLAVGLGAGVLVGDVDGDGGAEGATLEDAGEDARGVGLVARGDDVALAGAAAVEIALDVGLGEREARRDAVDDHADAAAVGFAPGGDAEGVAELRGHGARSVRGRVPGVRRKVRAGVCGQQKTRAVRLAFSGRRSLSRTTDWPEWAEEASEECLAGLGR